METTRKKLREEAARLKAIKVSNNIYIFENIRSFIGREEKDIPANYRSVINEVINSIKEKYPQIVKLQSCNNIYYSCGIYGNNGRLDSVGGYDNEGHYYDCLGYIYY